MDTIPRHSLQEGRSDILEKACECMVGGHLLSPCLEESFREDAKVRRVDSGNLRVQPINKYFFCLCYDFYVMSLGIIY